MFHLEFEFKFVGELKLPSQFEHRGMYAPFEDCNEFIRTHRNYLSWFKLTYERDCPLFEAVQENQMELFYNAIPCWFKRGELAVPFDPRGDMEDCYHNGCEPLCLPAWKYLKEFLLTHDDYKYGYSIELN